MGSDHPKDRQSFSIRSTKPKPKGDLNVTEAVNKLKDELKSGQTGFDYRTASLKIHGPVCASCGREFSGKNLRLLTVHHKDGDHANNRRDGSNWENLCIDCHEHEHSRGLHADYISSARDKDAADPGKQSQRKSASQAASAPGEGKSTLAELFQKAMKKK
jgi:5-methylcytosine-specific restriction endonuclease McrA